MVLRSVNEDYRPQTQQQEMISAQNFRWTVGGSLSIAAMLLGALGFMLMTQIGDMKTDFKSQISELKTEIRTYQTFILDIQGDVRTLSQQSVEQANQINQLRDQIRDKKRY